jgi:hypothetical protein
LETKLSVLTGCRNIPMLRNFFLNFPNFLFYFPDFLFCSERCYWWIILLANGPIPYNEQNFDLDKSRQKFHYSLKEHHKISTIPKFRCEMLQNADDIALRSLPFFSHFVLRTGN